MTPNKNVTGAMEPETIQKNGASPKSQMSRGNVIFFIFTLLISAFMFISCGNGVEPKTELELKKDELKVKSAELVQKGNELRTKAGQYESGNWRVDVTLNNYKNMYPNKTDAYYWKMLTEDWLSTSTEWLQSIGAYDLTQQILNLSNEILALEARIAQLEGKTAYNQNSKYFGNKNLATWDRTLLAKNVKLDKRYI